MTKPKSRVILGDAFRIAHNVKRESRDNLHWARKMIQRSIDALSSASSARSIKRNAMVAMIDAELASRA